MPKGQERGNREAKKPKANKKTVVVKQPVSITKQVNTATPPPKKKG